MFIYNVKAKFWKSYFWNFSCLTSSLGLSQTWREFKRTLFAEEEINYCITIIESIEYLKIVFGYTRRQVYKFHPHYMKVNLWGCIRSKSKSMKLWIYFTVSTNLGKMRTTFGDYISTRWILMYSHSYLGISQLENFLLQCFES